MNNITIKIVNGKVDWDEVSRAIDEFRGEIDRLYAQRKATADLIKRMKGWLMTYRCSHLNKKGLETLRDEIAEADAWLKENEK